MTSAPPLRILYIHHAGAFGGASRSLLELIDGFPAGSVVPRLVTQRGSVGAVFAGRRVEVIEAVGISQFDHTRYGHYQGKRWLVLLRELFYLPFTFAALMRARRRWKRIDLVHVNEIVLLAPIVLASRLFRCPIVVHVRSVQHPSRSSLRSGWVSRVLRKHAAAVIAIDETVRRSLPDGIAAEVVHNAYTPQRGAMHPAAAGPPLPPRREGTLRVAMVGNLLPLKGVQEFLEAARLCHERGLKVDFLMVGGNTRELSGLTGLLLKMTGFARDMEAKARRFVAAHRLDEIVHLVPFTREIDRVYASVDLLCFPSLLDAPGRPVIEAAWWKVPSIVAVESPSPDTIVHRETGLCVKPAATALADAIEYCSRNPGEVKRMGEAAHRLALANFDARKNAERVLEIYRRVMKA